MSKEKNNYTVDTENLAVPEVHTGKAKDDVKEDKDDDEITYDNVAIPEIHHLKKKKD